MFLWCEAKKRTLKGSYSLRHASFMCTLCCTKHPLHRAAFVLVLIGALNWGLIGLFNLNLVSLILGFMPFLLRLVYLLVGLSAVLLLMPSHGDHAMCEVERTSSSPTPPVPSVSPSEPVGEAHQPEPMKPVTPSAAPLPTTPPVHPAPPSVPPVAPTPPAASPADPIHPSMN